MNLAELIAEVYTLTGRPDRVAETLSAVKSATLKAHQCDYFPKDLFESGLAFDTSEYVQNLDYRSILPRWRAVKYFRKYDNVAASPGNFLQLIQPENVLDNYGVQKQDIFYQAGAYIQINSSTQEQYYLFGCYLNPDVTESGYDSWVALDHPYCIVFDAAATVFKVVGKDEETSNMRNLVAEQISLLRSSNILAEGF